MEKAVWGVSQESSGSQTAPQEYEVDYCTYESGIQGELTTGHRNRRSRKASTTTRLDEVTKGVGDTEKGPRD